MYFNP